MERLEKRRDAASFNHAGLMIMTAAVDMKPTLTLIKAEKMDGKSEQLRCDSSHEPDGSRVVACVLTQAVRVDVELWDYSR